MILQRNARREGVISILRFTAPFQPIRDPYLDFGAFGPNQWVRAAQIELNRNPYLIFHGPRETSLELLHHGYAVVCVVEVITWRSQPSGLCHSEACSRVLRVVF